MELAYLRQSGMLNETELMSLSQDEHFISSSLHRHHEQLQCVIVQYQLINESLCFSAVKTDEVPTLKLATWTAETEAKHAMFAMRPSQKNVDDTTVSSQSH